MQHLRAIGQTGEVKRASTEEVRERIERIWERMEEERRGDIKTLGERLEIRKEEEDQRREERKEKRKEIVERKKAEREGAVEIKKEYGEDVRVEGEHDEDDMMASMGITGFGTSKR
jgi:U4/U6.U5 tri-snRNP component SNU23